MDVQNCCAHRLFQHSHAMVLKTVHTSFACIHTSAPGRVHQEDENLPSCPLVLVMFRQSGRALDMILSA